MALDFSKFGTPVQPEKSALDFSSFGTPVEVPAEPAPETLAARASTPAGFMLRPEFVEQVRTEYGNLPPEQRRAALQTEAQGRGVRADAAKRILADLAVEDQRRREMTQGRAGLMGILAQQQPAPSRPAAPQTPARVEFPDVSPTIGDIMDMVPEQERIQRRLAQDQAARTLEAAESSIEATRAREQERMGGLEQIGKSFTEVGIPTAEAGLLGLTAVAQQAQMAKIADQLKALEAQGKSETPEADRLRRVLEHYSKRQQVYLGDIAQTQAKLSTAPVYRGVRELTEAETFTDAAKAFARDPIKIVANLTAQSLPSMLPALVLGVINPALGAAAMGGSSYGVEFGNELLGFAREKGFDPADPQQMSRFMQNQELLREGVNRAGTKAGIVAAGDMLLTGLAAKTLVPKRITGPVAKNVTNVGVQMGVQGVGGGGVEALSQLATTGEIKPGEVVAEAVGELGGAPAEVLAQTSQARREARAAQQAAAAAPPPSAPPPAAPTPPTAPAAPAAEPERVAGLFEQLAKESQLPPAEAPAAVEAPAAPVQEAAPPVAPPPAAPVQEAAPPAVEAPAAPPKPEPVQEAAPRITELQQKYDQAKAALDALGPEPPKPSSESRFFGAAGREGAAPDVIKSYDDAVKANASWRRKYSKLKKAEVDASNELFRERQELLGKTAAPVEEKAEGKKPSQPEEIKPTVGKPVSEMTDQERENEANRLRKQISTLTKEYMAAAKSDNEAEETRLTSEINNLQQRYNELTFRKPAPEKEERAPFVEEEEEPSKPTIEIGGNIIGVQPNGKTRLYKTQDGITIQDVVRWEYRPGVEGVGRVDEIIDSYGGKGFTAIIKDKDNKLHLISTNKLTKIGETNQAQDARKAADVVTGEKPPADLPAKNRLILMPCCDKKGAAKAPAMDLYQGVFFQTFKANVKSDAKPKVVILSAKHGFIDPTKEIEPYDQLMGEERAQQMLSNLDKQVKGVDWPSDIKDVLIVGGKTYQKVMRAAVADLKEKGIIPADATVNATSGGIGEQRQQLGEYLRNIPEPKTARAPEAPAEEKAEGKKPPVLPVPEGFEPKKGRKTQLVMAARELAAGRITKAEYDEYVEEYLPITTVLGGVIEQPVEDGVMTEILTKKIKQKKDPDKVNAPVADGTRVGLRMDIPALEWGKANGVNGSVVSIHKGAPLENATAGDNLSYRSTGAIKNVKMAIRREDEAFLIAQQAEPELRRKKTGEEYLKAVDEKKPQQTLEGEWVNMSPEETFRLIQQNLDNPDWVQVSLDPLRHSYFYARDSKRPVVAADEALQVGRFVLVKNPVYADREKFLYSLDPAINPPVTGEADQRSPSFKREIAKLKGQHTRGLMTDKEFADRVDTLIDADARRRFEQQMAAMAKGRVRGSDFILEKLLNAKRKGDISDEAYKLAQWFIEKNPQLVEELGISIKAPGERAVAGQYDVNRMIMVLIKGRGSDLTAVHEVLHHLERMMPPDIQAAIRKEWTKQLLSAQKKAKTPQEKLYFQALVNHHFGEPIMSSGSIPPELRKLYYDSLLKMDVESERVPAMKLANFLLTTSQVGGDFYQYYNPSEFWAVNGSEIVRGRYDAIKGGVLIRLKNWLKELGQKIKSIFGLQSDAPLIKALDSLAKSDGKFVTDEILDQSTTLYSIEPTEPEEAAPPRTMSERLRDNWIISKDELGRTRFTPGAVAYRTAATLANNVLDRVGLKPISPELGRAMRNMRVQVENVQKKTANLAQELAKMSPQERELISDVIEGELKAGVQPPENVLNIAASMQELMKRQSDELVRLGMLSKESAQRWEYKYLPRFYLNNLKDDINAWSKAAKNLIRRQPVMQGVVGKNLKARGMFETIPVEDLQEWIDLGYEQRDPDFDPNRSIETVVWRDYTREERENMGEIRDAMFRFVMGYNASQRDIALGRLYEELADSYASKGPKEGFVQVPDTKVEGTAAHRYGKLAGMYVPREIMDHLVHNDQELANGVLKIYRAALSRWKEGKTVLNPVAHANNVISNLTMAHFAGVSYWDANKYAGAVKDMVTNSDLLKEADEVGLFSGSFSQAELVASMPPELQAMANMTESQIAKLGGRIWDLLSYTVEYKGRKIGVRPAAQWMYENEDSFFRFLIYRDARNRGLDPQDARDYSQQFIFTYDDLPRGARVLRDFAMPFFAYTYKVIPVLARTALEYPWRYAAPATVAYSVNAMMYAMAAGLGEDEDQWWMNVMYKYVTDPEFRAKAKELEQQERRNLPPWLKGESAALVAPKAIRLGMDDVTGMPLFLDISRIFPGGDILDAVNNSGGVALLQPLTPSNPVLTTLVAMLANKDMFFGKDVVTAKDTEEEKTQKRLAWLWRQATPAISVGNYHFDRGMNVLARITGKPIIIDAGPMGTVYYTGVGKDGLPVIPKYAALQTVGIKVRPYDLEMSEKIEQNDQNKLIRDLAIEISSINRNEQKGIIPPEVAELLKSKAKEKQQLLRDGMTVEGKPRE